MLSSELFLSPVSKGRGHIVLPMFVHPSVRLPVRLSAQTYHENLTFSHYSQTRLIFGMKAHLSDTHPLVPRSRSSAKVYVKYQGHVSQKMGVSGGITVSQTHLVFICSLQVSVLVLAHTRELAFQISQDYEKFSKYMNNIKIAVFFGGMPIKKDEEVLKKNCPHIVVGTPGRILALAKSKALTLKHVKHFILDECDKMLCELGKCVNNFFFSVVCL